jgi:hypothetical protein
MSRRRRRSRRHDVLIMLLLGVLAVVAALIWLAEHLAVLTGIALLMWGAYYLGRHGRRQARPAISPRPGQARPEEPAAAGAVPTVTLPHADYDWDDQGAPRPLSGPPAGADRDSLLNTPMSGVHQLWTQP